MSYHHNWEHVCLQELGMATPEGATTAGDGGQTPAWYDVAAAMMQQQGWPAAAGAPTAGMYAQLQQGGVQSQQQQSFVVTAPMAYTTVYAPGSGPGQVQTMFDRLDRNHDGVISQQEWQAAGLS